MRRQLCLPAAHARLTAPAPLALAAAPCRLRPGTCAAVLQRPGPAPLWRACVLAQVGEVATELSKPSVGIPVVGGAALLGVAVWKYETTLQV